MYRQFGPVVVVVDQQPPCVVPLIKPVSHSINYFLEALAFCGRGESTIEGCSCRIRCVARKQLYLNESSSLLFSHKMFE